MRALFEKDTPTAQCQPWCQPVDDHIRWCKCSGCEFAQSGMKIGDTCSIDPDLKCKPVDDNDLPFESCSTWCSERYLDSHCSMCACKRCGFCKAEIAGRKACKSYTPRGDVDYERCDGFCKEVYKEAHCSLCRCRGCGYCAGEEMCDPRVSDECGCEPYNDGDSHVMKCADFCSKPSHCQISNSHTSTLGGQDRAPMPMFSGLASSGCALLSTSLQAPTCLAILATPCCVG